MFKNKRIEMIKKAYKETKKSSLLVYLILRALVILCMILQILNREWENVILCLLSLILFIIPFFIQKKFKITLPNALESIIFIFIFSAEILGEINNFYGIIPYWDTMLHTINGFLAAGVGFSLVDLLNKNSKNINLSPVYLAIVSFCFSMTIGVVWEFFEFGMDYYFKFDMQKDRIVERISSVYLDETKTNTPVIIDNIDKTIIYSTNDEGDVEELIIDGYLDIGIIDTMKDLLVNFIGAFTFSIIGALYVSNREKYVLASNFIPTKNI